MLMGVAGLDLGELLYSLENLWLVGRSPSSASRDLCDL